MAKPQKVQKSEDIEEISSAKKIEMTLEEAKAFRASLYKPQPKVLSDAQKREAFRVWWAGNKKKYGQSKFLEYALWLHLKSIKMDDPENFEAGIFNFGFKKVK